jgi:hypothetical protein
MPLRCTRRINNKTSAPSRIGDCHLMIIIASKPAPDVEMIAAAWPMRWCRPQLFDAAVIQSISNLDASHGMIERC